MKVKQKLNLVIALGILTTASSQAALVLADGVTGVVDNGSLFAVTNLNITTDMNLGGDGLTADDLFTTNHSSSNAWVSNQRGGDYFGNPVTVDNYDPVLTFTFAASQARVQGMTIWSSPGTGGPENGVSAGTVEFFNGASSLGTETLAIGIGNNGSAWNPGSVNAFTSNYDSVTSAVVTFTDNHAGGALAGGDRVGAGTVAFDVVAVPEPSSAALLGLGGLALILRRRK